MKSKMFTVSVISLLTVLLLMLGYRIHTASTKSASEIFTQLIYDEKHHDLNDEVLTEYKKEIYQELSLIESQFTLLTSYLSLGKINALQRNYADSNRYLVNALSFISSEQLELTFFIYEQLALNYVHLNQIEQGYKYFKLAYEVATHVNDVKLITSLYQLFASSLLVKTDDLAFSIYLMQQTLELVEDTDRYIQSNILLASMYQSSGLYKLSLNQWIKALDISREEQYYELEPYILVRLATLYFLTDQHEKVLLTLSEYFQFEDLPSLLDCISMWLKSYYHEHGFESSCEMFRQLSDEVDKFSKSIKYVYQYVTYLNYAGILLEEKHYDECQKYIEIIKQLQTPQSAEIIDKLWFSKLELDFNYMKNNHEIDYKASYAQLLSAATQKKSYYTQREYIFIHSVLKTLLQLEDFESINNYYKLYQFPMKKELRKLMKMTTDNNVEGLNKKQWTQVEAFSIFYYIFVIFSITGIVYVLGYRRPKIKMLSNSNSSETETDSLTKTLTKEVLYHQLEFDINSDSLRELSFILLDIDDFKSYNRDFGYSAGDKVLKEIAILLQQFFPNGYICRYLGQQFLIIIKSNQHSLLVEMISELKEQIRTNKKISNQREITVSVGMSCGEIEDALEINQHIHIATQKLRKSKKMGSGVCKP